MKNNNQPTQLSFGKYTRILSQDVFKIIKNHECQQLLNVNVRPKAVGLLVCFLCGRQSIRLDSKKYTYCKISSDNNNDAYQVLCKEYSLYRLLSYRTLHIQLAWQVMIISMINYYPCVDRLSVYSIQMSKYCKRQSHVFSLLLLINQDSNLQLY